MVIYAVGWSFYLYGPLFQTNNDSDLDEFYGKVVKIGRTSHVDIVHLHFNSAHIEFLMYLDEENIHYLNNQFDESKHYRVITQRISDFRQIVLAMENSDFAIDSTALIEHMSKLKKGVLIFWLVGLFTLAHIFFMEVKYYSKGHLKSKI